MTLNKYLKWTVIGALCASLITPLIVSDSLFFPFIVGKALFFRIMVEIAFCAWLLLSLRDASVRPRLSAIMWSFAAFVVVVGLADILGMNAWKSFWSNFERMEGFLTILHLALYFLVASSIFTKDYLWKRFFQVSIGASVIVSLYGLSQLGDVARLDSTLGNATYLAVYLMFNIFFVLMFLLKEKNIWKNIGWVSIIVIHLIVMYYTGTRSAALGLILGLFVTGVLIALFDKSDKKIRIIAGSLAGLAVLTVVGFMAIKDTSFVQNSKVLSRFNSVSLSSFPTQARYYIWPMAIEGFKEKPLLGWGQENFNYVFNERYSPKLYGQEQWFDRTHNAMLDWLIAAGGLGLASYLALFISTLYLLWRRSTGVTFTEKSVLTGLGVAYVFNNMFVFDNITSYMLFVVILAYVHYKSTRLSTPVAEDADEFDVADTRVAGGLILLFLFFIIYFFNWRAYATSRDLILAMRATNAPTVQADVVTAAFEKALSYDTIGRPEIVERMVESVNAINGSNSSIESRQKYYTLAREALETQLERVPGDARYELFAGSFYSGYGLNEEAEIHYKKAVELSPTKQTMYFALGSFYINLGKINEAVDAFKKAYELDTTNQDAARFYAGALVYAKKEVEAKALMKEVFGTEDLTHDVFIQAYAVMKNWPKVISVLKARIAAEEGNMDLMQNLAAAYFQAGDKANAIATFRKMIEIDPSYKEIGEDYIKQIQVSP